MNVEWLGAFERLDVVNETWQQHCHNLLTGTLTRLVRLAYHFNLRNP
jgi:hypothetical protein